MIKQANLGEWRKLYEIAIKIKELKPWVGDVSTDFIEVREAKKTTLCNIIKGDNLFYGIVAYFGDKNIDSFLYGLINYEEIPFHQQIRYQNNLTCYFADREQVSDQDYKIIKELGLKFRGKKEWVFFKCMESDHDIRNINKNEVINFTKVLEQVYEGILDNKCKKVKYDEENGEIQVRHFDKKRKVWLTQKNNLENFEYSYTSICLSDEVLIKRMQKTKYNMTRLEFDIVSVPLPKNPFGKLVDGEEFLRIAVLADMDKEVLISDCEVELDEEHRVNAVFDSIIPYILKEGRPSIIVVRDTYVASFLWDLCSKLNIELEIYPELEVIDGYVEGFLGAILESELEI
ncbi:MAG: DUF7309 domain-containing protein [Sarcina sp.]